MLIQKSIHPLDLKKEIVSSQLTIRAAFKEALKEVHAFATRIGKQPDLLWKESKSAVDRCAVVLRNDKR